MCCLFYIVPLNGLMLPWYVESMLYERIVHVLLLHKFYQILRHILEKCLKAYMWLSYVHSWKYNNTRNTISFYVSKISFIFFMTPIDSTNDQNTAQSYLRVHLHVNHKKTHQRKNLKLPYLHCYIRNICKMQRVDAWIYQEGNVQFGK